ncbi:hypothetical protein AOLI_G00127000 [Acnodon oligacanthus]
MCEVVTVISAAFREVFVQRHTESFRLQKIAHRCRDSLGIQTSQSEMHTQETSTCNTFTLTIPRSHNISGYCHHLPQPTIEKMKEEESLFSKTPYTACGSIGVLTYQIHKEGSNPAGELAIMFSVPYDYTCALLHDTTQCCPALMVFESRLSHVMPLPNSDDSQSPRIHCEVM